MPRQFAKPLYRLHKPSGRARVRVDGQDIDLPGAFGSPESREHYDEVVSEWLSRQDVDYARGDNSHIGEPMREFENIQIVQRMLVTFSGRYRARDFGPRTDAHCPLQNKGSSADQRGLAADWQRSVCQSSECLNADVQLIRELDHVHLAWPHLPAHC